MNRMLSWFALALLVACLAEGAVYAPPDRGRTVASSVVIGAPAAEIFGSFTTPEGLVKAWGVAKAKVDFRVGGQIRTAYQPDTDLDSPKAIVNTILAYEPDRMLAIKATAPEGSPDWLLAICETGWNVLRLEPLGPALTRVTCTGMGYKDGPLFDQALKFFKTGNDWTLKQMKEKFEGGGPGPSDTDAFAIMQNMVGGDWIAETNLPDGSVMLGRTVWRRGVGGFIVADGWLGDGGGMRPHGLFVCGPDPATGGTAFWNFGDQGDIAGGHARRVGTNGEKRVALDWTTDAPGGEAKEGALDAHHVEITLDGADTYVLTMWHREGAPPAGTEPDVKVVYRRVDRAPEKFTRAAGDGAR
ncbi:MAG: SRPBCC domain-containing protein [Phycisphaerales bacterium]